MIYTIINGLFVEAETVAEVHLYAEIKCQRYANRRKKQKSLSEDDTLTEIIREISKQINREK